MFNEMEKWQKDRLGKLTSSEIYKIVKTGTRKMTEEELKNREKGNRRTTVETLFGDTAITYISDCVGEILTGEPKSDLTGVRATEWGNVYESEAGEAFEKYIGKPIEFYGGANPQFYHFNAYSGGSPDGLLDDAVLEIKCPYNTANHVKRLLASRQGASNDWLRDNNEDYYWQVQFNMMCTERNKAYLVSYDPRVVNEENRLAVIIVSADEQDQKLLEERVVLAAEEISRQLEVIGI